MPDAMTKTAPVSVFLQASKSCSVSWDLADRHDPDEGAYTAGLVLTKDIGFIGPNRAMNVHWLILGGLQGSVDEENYTNAALKRLPHGELKHLFICVFRRFDRVRQVHTQRSQRAVPRHANPHRAGHLAQIHTAATLGCAQVALV